MLEHVTSAQTRFVAPGLSSDARGVALGRFCVVLLPSVDRVVGLFRGLSERGSLDDLLPSLRILQVRTPLRSREFIVQIPVHSSHVADGVASVAALMGGLTFTGSSKHFVRYRDARSPLGYDVDQLHGGKGDFVLYAEAFVQAYDRERELPFTRLALSLSLEQQLGDELLPEEHALLRVEPGLWRVTAGYLHRYNLPCHVAACEARPGAAGGEPRRFYLIRGRLERRMERLFRRTPGVEVYRLVGERVAVQLGYRHPFELSACATVFEEDSFYLFSGERDCLDRVPGGLTFVSSGSLVHLGEAVRAVPEHELRPRGAGAFNVPLQLVASSGSRPPVRACRIPVAQAEYLKKLVYLLPPQVLEGYSICCSSEHIYLYSETQVEFIPLGDMFYQAALGVLVPVGYELLPRVHPDVLVQHLRTGSDGLVFFTHRDPAPLQLPRGAFIPLTRQALARIPLEQVLPVELPTAMAPAEGTLVNEPVGLFPLWGFDPERQSDSER